MLPRPSPSFESSKKKKREITTEEIIKYSQKKALKVAKKLKSQAVSGYSNDSNPFGDSNLGEKFVWRKKIERDVVQGKPLDISVKAEKKRQKESKAEIEKVKNRREERAIEKAQHEEEMALLAREQARAEFEDWEKREEEFHFDQSKIRSQIRLREGRMTPIDILSKNLNVFDDFDIEINEPYTVLKGLTAKEMEELRDDIKTHLDLDRATPIHIEFWEATMVVCNWELAEAWKRDALDRARVRGEEPPAEILAEERGLHSSIEADVKRLLEGKTSVELESMRQQIELDMRSGTAKVVEYWEAILKRLQIYKAKARLKEIHADLLRKHLQRLEQPVEAERGVDTEGEIKTEEEDMMHGEEDVQPISPEIVKDEQVDEPEEEPGSFSPQLLHADDDEEAIDPEADQTELKRKREAVMVEHQRRNQEAMAAKAAVPDELELKAMKAMGALEDGDTVFGSGAEVNLDLQMSTRVLPSKESKTRREVLVWTTHMDNVFIESMLFQHREGNHQDGVFSSCAYNDMLKDTNEKFPSMNIKRENLKNRLKTIKQNFSKCYDIFKSASNSGFGWNPESKKWEAEPEVWEILIQSKPEAAEWRIKSINKYDELEELFAKDRATGEGAETAKEKKRRWAKTKANSVCEDNVDTVDGIDFLLSRNEINLEGFSGEFEGDNVDVEILPDVPSSQVPSQSGATSSKGKRRKNETLEEGLITSLDKIANAIERSTDAILQSSASLGRFRSRVISSEEITEALEEMGVEGQFFDDAFEFLTDNPEKAKKIFGYPKMGRLRYLEKLVYPTHGTS